MRRAEYYIYDDLIVPTDPEKLEAAYRRMKREFPDLDLLCVDGVTLPANFFDKDEDK